MYRKFKSDKAGLEEAIAQVYRYTTGEVQALNGKPKTTIGSILEAYCPVSDGCNHNDYITSVGSIAKSFGQTYDGSKMSPTASEEERKAGVEKRKRETGLDILIDKNVVNNAGTGLNKGNVPLGMDMVNWAYQFSDKTTKILM